MHTKSGNKTKQKIYSMGCVKEKDKGALTRTNEMQQTRETVIQPSRLLRLGKLSKLVNRIHFMCVWGGWGGGGGKTLFKSSH